MTSWATAATESWRALVSSWTRTARSLSNDSLVRGMSLLLRGGRRLRARRLRGGGGRLRLSLLVPLLVLGGLLVVVRVVRAVELVDRLVGVVVELLVGHGQATSSLSLPSIREIVS